MSCSPSGGVGSRSKNRLETAAEKKKKTLTYLLDPVVGVHRVHDVVADPKPG
jgi:hypothetical protein